MGLGGLVRCRTTMLWKPVWFPHQTCPLGPLICWVVCVLGDTCLPPQSSLLPASHFPALSFSATATAGSAAFIFRQQSQHIHIMWHQVTLNTHDEYTSGVCACACGCGFARLLHKHAAHEYRWYDHLRTEHVVATIFLCAHKCRNLHWMSRVQVEMQFAIFPPSLLALLITLTWFQTFETPSLPPQLWFV